MALVTIVHSLDAGSSSVQISLKAGGLKMIQIQDNGCGIQVYCIHGNKCSQ